MRNFILFAALMGSTVVIPTVAQAQRVPAAIVAIVDSARIYRDCTACKAAQSQLQSQANALTSRQQTLANQLRPEGESLQNSIKALNGKQPDAALRARVQAFQQKEQQANRELSETQRRIQSTQANVLRQINDRLRPIINQVMTARGANIAVDVDATLAHSQGVDVTNDVIAQLNRALPSVSVTPGPQQQQQQPQGR